MGVFKPLCLIMSLTLSFLLEHSNIYKMMNVDVLETDGKYVIWREADYLETDSDLIFKARSDLIDRVYISYDDGKSYRQFMSNMGSEIILNSEDFSEPVCIAFMTDNYVSKQFRIKFINCNTFT